jgi:ATP/maltotriose-dependent transcriptional regulator MalT/DNA-binding SARP family transcriptional activator
MVEGDIHKAKITRPLFRGSLPRERLFRLLDGGRNRPVTWVSGPPGSGKTTLVSGYLESRKLPCLWYRVDKGDADPASFFHYLGIATQAALPRKRKPLPGPASSDLSAIGPFARRYFGELFNRLGSRAVLVFDEWENAIPGSFVETAVREGIHLFPKGVRAILVSRSEPSPDFIREVDSRRLESLGWKDLRLTAEETAEIARIQRRDASPETVRYLHGKAGGWATGVVLLLESAQRDGIEPEHIGRRTPEEIVEYLGGDLFRNLEAETRAFLVRTAFLPRMTGRTAGSLTGHPKASRILSYLNRHNLFTEVRPGEEPVYEYHSLFREFLLQRAKSDLSLEEACATRHRAAALLEDSGQTTDAVDLLRRCGDFRGVCRVIRKEGPSLTREGRSQAFGEWILSLPKDLRDEDPWLLYWTGVCSHRWDPGESRAAFERGFDLFSRAGDEAGTFLSWSGIVDAILFQWNDFKSLDRWIDWLDRRVAEGAAFPFPEIEARVSASMAGALHRRRPQHPDIRAWIDRALSASRAAGDGNLALQSLVHAANHHHWTGDRSAASLALEEVGSLSRSPAVSPAYAILGMSVEASTLLWADADGEGALRIVSEGLDATRRPGMSHLGHLFFAAGAYAALLAGDGKAAGEYLGKLKAALPATRRFAECQYDYLCAWHHLLRGDRPGAAAHAERALANAEAAGAVFPEILCRLALANIAEGREEREKREEARAHLLGIGDRIRSSGNRIFEFMERLTAARIAFGSGDEGGGLQALREGMTLGRKQGYVSLFWWWEPKAMTRLCIKALEAGIEVEYVLGLIRKNRLVPDPSTVDLESWPWPVKVYTLGRFSLVVDGKVLPSARKTRQKPLLLLKALIALGGREVSEEQFTEILWPDADGDLAHQSLAKTLERLREMLGDDRAVLLRDGRLTLNNRYCWVDVWEFERILGRADAARKPGARVPNDGEVARLAERAIALYQGAFLSGETFCSGIVTHRERLRSKFLRTVVRAGRHWEQAGEWEKAIVCNQKGLEVDPLSEDLYRGLISCNLRMGRAAEAHAVYQRCCKTLSAVLGVNPSPDLQTMLTAAPAPIRE